MLCFKTLNLGHTGSFSGENSELRVTVTDLTFLVKLINDTCSLTPRKPSQLTLLPYAKPFISVESTTYKSEEQGKYPC